MTQQPPPSVTSPASPTRSPVHRADGRLSGELPRRALLTVAGSVLVMSGVAGCGVGGSSGPSTTTAKPTPARQEPTQADLEDFRRRIRALPHVTAVTLTYRQGTFGNGPSSEATITSDATDQATLNTTLDQTYRMVWASHVSLGWMNYVVTNPATGAGADYKNLGIPDRPAIPELVARYGQPPSAGGSSTTTPA